MIWLVLDRILLFIHKRTFFALNFFARHTHDENKRNEIMQRVKTFRGLILQSIRIFNGLFFIFLLLHNFGVDPKPLLAGVGVVGLGLSLAAQNILRYFLNGLFIVIEDQYNVGDWVDIGSYSGTVENFSLRITRLRAMDGRQIIIPNSSIVQVVNYTKSWAVSNVEIGISYDARVSDVVRTLERCCDELMSMYPGVILERPNIQSIVDFRPNDVLIRVLTKTLAGEQWAVGRALRRIIKEKFDDAGIDIPVPQMVLHDAAKESAARAERQRALQMAREAKEAEAKAKKEAALAKEKEEKEPPKSEEKN